MEKLPKITRIRGADKSQQKTQNMRQNITEIHAKSVPELNQK